MKPKINVLVNEGGEVKVVTREMTDEEYAEHLAMLAENTPQEGAGEEAGQ
jgi:predicted DNA-binding antitoxin AbrB/MazE fold protein